jgi:hypothetical protein
MSTKTTARFELERKRQLKTLFTRKRMVSLWRSLVKDQMRRFDIRDLHDYYDFNFSIESRCDAIIERVLSGHYRADGPLVYRVEKKLGVCRHLMIPSPSDALVFQLLTDSLYSPIVRAQPSKRAYYARDRHSLALPHEHEEAKSYPWFVLWPKFQVAIWNFSKAHRFLVTTDITNYFDNIGLRELRHVISAIAKTKEVYLDLLFSLIEDLSWNPDYLPTSHKGLPTINIEAPRLLAHALLFEVDYVLKKRTRNNFVRWMDDINFGVNDKRAAKTVLGELNDVLKSRGLAINLAKTEVLTAKQARFHFMFDENQQLDGLHRRAKALKLDGSKKRLATKIASQLEKHLTHSEARNADKVTKRYFTILGTLEVPVGLAHAEQIYVDKPALRPTILQYLIKLPFKASVRKSFLRLFDKTEAYDDATRFGLVATLVDWTIPRNRAGRAFVLEVAKRLKSPSTAFDWLCQLYFLSKYGEPHDVLSVAASRMAGAKEPFFARQRIAALARGLSVNPTTVKREWRAEVSTGFTDSASVATNFLSFAYPESRDRRTRLHMYLFPSNRQRTYPLPKFLILCAIAHSERKSKSTTMSSNVQQHVSDEWYIHWLKQARPDWFIPTP